MIEYTLSMRKALYSKVQELPNGKEITWSKYGGRSRSSIAIDNANFLRCNRGEDLDYFVHLVAYKSTKMNETVPPAYYTDFPFSAGWLIEASLANYNPDDVISVIKEIDRCLEKYNVNAMMDPVVELALLHDFIPTRSEDCEEIVPKLTQRYIIENNLDVAKDSIDYQVLVHVLTLILEEMVYDEYNMLDIADPLERVKWYRSHLADLT